MSVAYPATPTPAPRVRPSTVTISSLLLFGVAAIQLISVILAFAASGETRRVMEEAYAGVEGADAVAGVTTAFTIGGAILGLLIGVGLVVLAIFNNRGKQPSRITTWVVAGILVCCSGFGVLGTASSGMMNFGNVQADPNVPSPAEVQDRINAAIPWYHTTTVILNVLTLLALLGAIILLALPPSNEFFRKPAQHWEPPTPGGGYQAYPAYPAPGAPTQPPGTTPSSGSTPPPGTPPAGDPGPGTPPAGGTGSSQEPGTPPQTPPPPSGN